VFKPSFNALLSRFGLRPLVCCFDGIQLTALYLAGREDEAYHCVCDRHTNVACPLRFPEVLDLRQRKERGDDVGIFTF
jgi:hypothetical protein